jgi:hypothetical protein
MKNDRRGPAKQQHRQKDEHGTGADGRNGHVQLVTDDLSTSQDPGGGGSDTAPEKLPPQAQGTVRICFPASQRSGKQEAGDLPQKSSHRGDHGSGSEKSSHRREQEPAELRWGEVMPICRRVDVRVHIFAS